MQHRFEFLDAQERFSGKQRQMLDLLAQGVPVSRIARTLRISRARVDDHLRDVREALGGISQAELCALDRLCSPSGGSTGQLSDSASEPLKRSGGC